MMIRFEKFQELTLGDTDFSKELVEVYVSQFEEYIVEIQKLAEERDTDKIKFLNHQIKSSVVTLQFDSLIEKQGLLLKSIFQNDSLEKTRQLSQSIAQDCQKAIQELKTYYQSL